jgi:methylated-DNA-protein-cysteine methyltransferase related protein
MLNAKRKEPTAGRLPMPVSPPKSPLVTAICAAIRSVPRGRVSTYGAIAKAAGYPRCARHVGRVLKLVRGLPWQRILGAGGRISLRGEFAMEQRFLLEAEGVRFRGRRVDLREFEHRFSNRNPKLGAKSPASNSGRTSAVKAKQMHPKW